VNIDKDQIIQFLKDKGQHQQAGEAAQQLPNQVDADQYTPDLLARHGVDINDLVGRFGGGLGELV
jgi:hypothetical protein